MVGTFNFLEQRHPAAEVEYRNWQKAENSQNHPQPIFEWRKVCICTLSWFNKVSSDFKGLKILSFLGNWHVCKRDAEKRGASAVCKPRRKCHLKSDTRLVMEKTALRSGLTLVLPSRVPHPPAEWWCNPHRGWPLTDGRHSWSQIASPFPDIASQFPDITPLYLLFLNRESRLEGGLSDPESQPRWLSV